MATILACWEFDSQSYLFGVATMTVVAIILILWRR